MVFAVAGNYQKAYDFGEKSVAAAVEAEDDMWQLNATVLVAQSQGIERIHAFLRPKLMPFDLIGHTFRYSCITDTLILELGINSRSFLALLKPLCCI